jgi:hypothetical protein
MNNYCSLNLKSVIEELYFFVTFYDFELHTFSERLMEIKWLL